MFPSHLLYVWFVQCFVCYMCLLQYLGLSFCLTCPCFITVSVTIFLFIIVAMDSTYFFMKTFFIIFVMYTFYNNKKENCYNHCNKTWACETEAQAQVLKQTHIANETLHKPYIKKM